MSLFKKTVLNIFVLSAIIFPSFAFAATPKVAPVPPAPQKEIVLPINVILENSKIISQEGNNFKISFDIKNGKNIQVGVKYGVRLSSSDKNGKFILVDEKFYDESLTLLENSSTPKEITYTAPSVLDGEYNLWVTGSNVNSLPFTFASLGKVKLTSSVSGVLIDQSSCSLSVKEDKVAKKYDLNSHVDITPSETLVLNCNATNSDNSSVTVTPFYETTDSTSFGGMIIPSNGGDTNAITFKAKEKKVLSLVLPKVSASGSYRVKFGLKNADFTSNPLDIYYMTRGTSATIQNLILDKDYYNKDDQANLSLMWSTSFNNYVRGKNENNVSFDTIMTLSMTNDKGEACITPINQVIVPDYIKNKNEFSLPVIEKCMNPKVSITLSDKDGNVLDQTDFNVITSSLSSKTINTKTTIIIIIVILLILALGFFMSKKKSNLPVSVILGFVVLVGLPGVAKANSIELTASQYSAISGTPINLQWAATPLNLVHCHVFTNSNELYYGSDPSGSVILILSGDPFTTVEVSLDCTYPSTTPGDPYDTHDYLDTIDIGILPSGSINSGLVNCTIPSGSSNCSSFTAWTSSNSSYIKDMVSNTVFGTYPYNSGSQSQVIAIPFGTRTYKLYAQGNGTSIWTSLGLSNTIELESRTITASCAVGTSWSGSACTSSTLSNNFNNEPYSCNITTAGANSCIINMSWSSYLVSGTPPIQNYILVRTSNPVQVISGDIGASVPNPHVASVNGDQAQYYKISNPSESITFDTTSAISSCGGPNSPLYWDGTNCILPLNATFNSGTEEIIPYGSSAILSWLANNSNGTSCSISGGINNQVGGGYLNLPSLNYSSTASTGALNQTTTYTLTCTNPYTDPIVKTHTVRVSPYVSVTTSATSVAYNQPVTFSWTAHNALSCTKKINVGTVAGTPVTTPFSGSVILNLTSDTTFEVKCKNQSTIDLSSEYKDLSVVDSKTTTVGSALAPTVSLTATPSTVSYNGSSVLSWTTTNNPTSCTLKNIDDDPIYTGLGPSYTVSNIIENNTFTIFCINQEGSSPLSSVDVTVTNLPVPSVTVTVYQASVPLGGATTVSWTSQNTTSCTPSSSAGAIPGNPVSGINGSFNTGSLLSSVLYIVNCTGAFGPVSASESVSINFPTGEIIFTPEDGCSISGGADHCSQGVNYSISNMVSSVIHLYKNDVESIPSTTTNALSSPYYFNLYYNQPSTFKLIDGGFTLVEPQLISAHCDSGSSWNPSSSMCVESALNGVCNTFSLPDWSNSSNSLCLVGTFSDPNSSGTNPVIYNWKCGGLPNGSQLGSIASCSSNTSSGSGGNGYHLIYTES